MRLHNIILSLTLATSVASCDDGKIYDDASMGMDDNGITSTVKFTGDVEGIDSWTSGYSVVVAGFSDSEYAEVSRPVTGGDFEIDGITDDISSIELCVVNRLRKRVATFASVEPVKGSDGYIHFDVGNVDAGMFVAVQNAVFNAACVQCHGGSNHSAASLNLTEPDSYDALVNVASVKSPDMMRVTPGDASASVLWRAIATDISDDWAYRHHTIISNNTSADLVKNWIDAGAKK